MCFLFEGILEKEHVFDAFTDGDDWEGEVLKLSYSATASKSCQLHWVIEVKHHE